MIRGRWLRRVTAAVMNPHGAPIDIAKAIGVGVFLGCTPFFGFHAMLAAGVSFLFGLNFIYVFIGTQISNPLFASLLTAGSIGVGSYLLHETPRTVGRLSLTWLIGSLVVGGVLGTLAATVSYCAARQVRKRIETRPLDTAARDHGTQSVAPAPEGVEPTPHPNETGRGVLQREARRKISPIG